MQRDIDAINRQIRSQYRGIEALDLHGLSKQQRALIQLYQPHRSLVIYGTLAPDRPNHDIISHVPGTWSKGTIRGKLVDAGWGADLGYRAFRHVPQAEQQEIACYVLSSDALHEHWTDLDAFEGDGYARLVVQYLLENGEIGLGNVYAMNESASTPP